jgi:Cdc6-like AAA superfamily ATPase
MEKTRKRRATSQMKLRQSKKQNLGSRKSSRVSPRDFAIRESRNKRYTYALESEEEYNLSELEDDLTHTGETRIHNKSNGMISEILNNKSKPSKRKLIIEDEEEDPVEPTENGESEYVSGDSNDDNESYDENNLSDLSAEITNSNLEINFLPCREKEQEIIYNYVKKGLNTLGGYTGLYISGMPGTGKTACVNTVLNKLKNETKISQKSKTKSSQDSNIIQKFDILEINGMKVTNLANVYKQIYDFIFDDGRSTNAKKCPTLLDNFFRNRKDFDSKPQLRNPYNSHLVMIIDEIDCLINKKQTLLYNIFNWTTYSHSKLIIISISNTLDLPEKLLPKISSRMGNTRLCFKPYQKDELVKILSVKIDKFEMFSEDAIKLSAMKVAAVNGDLRRILQICKRAKEIFMMQKREKSEKIEKSLIIKAIEDLFDSKVMKVIQNLQIYEKLILAAILFQMKNETNQKVSVLTVQDRFNYFFLKYFGFYSHVTFEEYMLMIYNLVKIQIISFQENFSYNFIDNHLVIKFYPDEFTCAVTKDPKFEEILKELS